MAVLGWGRASTCIHNTYARTHIFTYSHIPGSPGTLHLAAGLRAQNQIRESAPSAVRIDPRTAHHPATPPPTTVTTPCPPCLHAHTHTHHHHADYHPVPPAHARALASTPLPRPRSWAAGWRFVRCRVRGVAFVVSTPLPSCPSPTLLRCLLSLPSVLPWLSL